MAEYERITLMSVDKIVDLTGNAKEFADLYCESTSIDGRRTFNIALVSLLINVYEAGFDNGRREARLTQTFESVRDEESLEPDE
jgi:hypothetical protein